MLFKRLNAPTRFEETDYYFANSKLPPEQKLPDGDLLIALHAYVSKLYSRTQEPGNQKVWKCMDETALIAFGILMEEAAKEVIGETGDLALVEALRSDEEEALADESQEEGLSRATSERSESQGHVSVDESSSSSSSLSDSASEYSAEESG